MVATGPNAAAAAHGRYRAAAAAATIPFIEAAKDNFHISSRNFCCVHCISRTIETRWLYIYVVVVW
jgi:hypothetical protein